MKEDIVAGLKAKFDQYDLWDVAERFYKDYKMDVRSDLMPEVRFEGHTLPSDDCFKTLVAARNAMKVKRPSDYKKYFDALTIKKILQIPYTQVIEAATSICRFTGFSEDTVCKWYEGYIDMFFVTKKTVNEFAEHISMLFDEKICKSIFREAIVLGADEAKRRIDGLITHTGVYAKEVLYNLYVKAPGTAYLFFPYYTDPVDAIEHLRECFDEETTAHILVSDTWYLYVYKHKAYHDTPHYHHDHKYIDNLVEKYQIQVRVANELRELRKRIIPDDASELWIEEFIPVFETIKGMIFEYPYCPKVMRALICTVTAFSACGVIVPEEFARYNDN